ncbi:2OG-Fe(II) oxygenase [Gluconacetobacter tumulisoli]|uniref:2OG-Fe(II) oxygenase n=1 Tax=Gluconacetobacter tumulisoli TaxID=1286189 RepID=A0A7W4K7R1_9PROT|nr:2OG-Fe(II) oxygenase [Gluconacetobacter tumulisoli]MBB2201906.1 2OG-Fe(II) oxygenase [Gluconacetobacter tumulisoli]
MPRPSERDTPVQPAGHATATARAGLAASLDAARGAAWPFAHWTLADILPPSAVAALLAWDPGRAARGGDTGGRREARNGHRVFVTPSRRAQVPGLAILADMFDAPASRQALAGLCGARLAGTALRLELCLDTDGFWLEPHTDIGAKKLTLLVSLSTDAGAADWGTDLMTGEGRAVVRASGAFNSGLLFVPAADSWHGFVRRPIRGLRRSLIVNFVGPDWRATDELAFGPAA